MRVREVSANTYLFLNFVHALPAPGALVGDILGACFVAQVLGDLAAVVLHVQEVGGEGTLRGVGVDGCALALLGTTGLGLGAGAAGTEGNVMGRESRGTNGEFNGSIATLRNVVHVLDVGLAQVRNVGLHLHQAHDNLWAIVSLFLGHGHRT